FLLNRSSDLYISLTHIPLTLSHLSLISHMILFSISIYRYFPFLGSCLFIKEYHHHNTMVQSRIKKIIAIVISIVILCCIGIGIYFLFFGGKKDKQINSISEYTRKIEEVENIFSIEKLEKYYNITTKKDMDFSSSFCMKSGKYIISYTPYIKWLVEKNIFSDILKNRKYIFHTTNVVDYFTVDKYDNLSLDIYHKMIECGGIAYLLATKDISDDKISVLNTNLIDLYNVTYLVNTFNEAIKYLAKDKISNKRYNDTKNMVLRFAVAKEDRKIRNILQSADVEDEDKLVELIKICPIVLERLVKVQELFRKNIISELSKRSFNKKGFYVQFSENKMEEDNEEGIKDGIIVYDIEKKEATVLIVEEKNKRSIKAVGE
ncbi:hypothetical protein SLOPH_854, partial [Spraguea lophii 42_110]